jgi:hypothetical protein
MGPSWIEMPADQDANPMLIWACRENPQVRIAADASHDGLRARCGLCKGIGRRNAYLIANSEVMKLSKALGA